MKKFLYCVSILFIALVLSSCKSKDVASKDDVEVVITSEESEDNEKKKKSDDEDKNLDEIEKADKGFVGWIDMGTKNPSYEDGLVKIATNSKLGTFCIYAIDANEKAYPVISSLNEYTTSSFYLKAGKKVFKLSANDKVKTGTAELENGIRLVYEIKNVATVIVEMEAFPALKDRPADTIKVTVTVKNIGKRVENFSVKTILDTILGENGKFHFYNCEGVPIRNEALYRSMRENKWFLSKNDRASMQIILDGGDVTPIEFVSLANYKTLEKGKWLPSMQAFGTFDNVLSYNNSAIGVIWPETRVEPTQSYETSFYISVGLDGMTPHGYKYVYNIETPEPVKEPEIINVIEKKSSDNVKVNESPEVVAIPENNGPESVVQEEPVPVDTNISEEGENPPIPNIEFNVKNISKDHLTTEYIQSLIDRIAELEKAGASASRGEILQLNAELDAILSILR